MNKWSIIHEYRRAGEAGLADRLLCPFDETELVTGIDNDDEPMLRCTPCKTDYHLEDAIFEKMETVLEHLR